MLGPISNCESLVAYGCLIFFSSDDVIMLAHGTVLCKASQ